MENIFLMGLGSIINLIIPQVFISKAHYLQSQHLQEMSDPAVRNPCAHLSFYWSLAQAISQSTVE